MAATDLTGAAIGAPDADGLAPWIVTVKAPAVNRVRMWTVAHTPCGVAVDLPQTLLQAAIKGKGSIPPCAHCTPADAMPAISHGMHTACHGVHLLGTPCSDGVQREPGPDATVVPATTSGHVHLASGACCSERPYPTDKHGRPYTAETIAATADAAAGVIIRPTCTRCQNAGESGACICPQLWPDGHLAEDVPATAWSLDELPGEDDMPEEHHSGMCGGPCDCGPEGPCKNDLGPPATPAELAQVYAEPPVAPDLALDQGGFVIPTARAGFQFTEPLAPTAVSAHDLAIGEHVPHPTAPVVTVCGRADRFDGPQDHLDVIRAGITQAAKPATGRAGMSALAGCERKLGYRLAYGRPAGEPAWRPAVGTAVHIELTRWYREDNARRVAAGLAERWLIFPEGQYLTEPADGVFDVFDLERGEVVDWKVPGITTVKKSWSGKVDENYKGQAQLYGRGLAMLGYHVRSVAILFLPSAGELSDAGWYQAPYDEAQALALVARRDKINAMLAAVRAVSPDQASADRTVLGLLEATEDHCGHCNALREGLCPGVVPAAAPALSLVGAPAPALPPPPPGVTHAPSTQAPAMAGGAS